MSTNPLPGHTGLFSSAADSQTVITNFIGDTSSPVISSQLLDLRFSILYSRFFSSSIDKGLMTPVDALPLLKALKRSLP